MPLTQELHSVWTSTTKRWERWGSHQIRTWRKRVRRRVERDETARSGAHLINGWGRWWRFLDLIQILASRLFCYFEINCHFSSSYAHQFFYFMSDRTQYICKCSKFQNVMLIVHISMTWFSMSWRLVWIGF